MLASPLHALTHKEVKFEWTVQCQQALDTLKEAITKAPVLVYPDFEKAFILETDACKDGLGALLSQKQTSGASQPIAYASHALSPPERNYSITDLKTLAVVWVIQHFRAYLYGHHVTVVTDHSAVNLY